MQEMGGWIPHDDGGAKTNHALPCRNLFFRLRQGAVSVSYSVQQGKKSIFDFKTLLRPYSINIYQTSNKRYTKQYPMHDRDVLG